MAMALTIDVASAWVLPLGARHSSLTRTTSFIGRVTTQTYLAATEGDDDQTVDVEFESEEQKKEVVGNLVADDEWDGLGMELSELVRKSCACTIISSFALSTVDKVCIL